MTLKLFYAIICLRLLTLSLPLFPGVRCDMPIPQLDMNEYSLAKALKIIYIYNFKYQKLSCVISTIIMFILKFRKQRFRNCKYLLKVHEWQSPACCFLTGNWPWVLTHAVYCWARQPEPRFDLVLLIQAHGSFQSLGSVLCRQTFCSCFCLKINMSLKHFFF